MHYYYPMMNGYDSGWNFVMMLFWLTFLVLGVVLVVRLIKSHDHNSSHANKSEPLDIAKERYAKGEITREEFEQLKKDLSR